MSLHEKIDAYHIKVRGDLRWRYRSWEHCFGFFSRLGPAGIVARRDDAALQLGFYLASWGMYRGSSFLLRHDYSVHLAVVDRLAQASYWPLWEKDVGCDDSDSDLGPLILDATEAVRESYTPVGKATDTLVTKVILGTLGCLPACDQLFIDGFKSTGFKYSCLNPRFVERIMGFCRLNSSELRSEQARIKSLGGLHYPLMKLVDMYFWQIGYDRWAAARNSTMNEVPPD